MYFFAYEKFLNPHDFLKYDVDLKNVYAISYVYINNYSIEFFDINKETSCPLSTLIDSQEKTHGILYEINISDFNKIVKCCSFNYISHTVSVIDNVNFHINWKATTLILNPTMICIESKPTRETCNKLIKTIKSIPFYSKTHLNYIKDLL